MYYLSEEEIQRLKAGLQAAFSIPFIDDVEDYVWEAVFAYCKNIPLVDPLFNTRTKQLFDIFDSRNPTGNIGWSAKTLLWNLTPGCEFELVIQRADIFDKARKLGFDFLNVDSEPKNLGAALLRHWYGKVDADAKKQQVIGRRVAILLKSKDYKSFACYEDDLPMYGEDEIVWRWATEERKGLHGIRYSDGFCVFKWYKNQKQLFERFKLPNDVSIFELQPTRLLLPEVVQLLLQRLNNP